MDRVVFIVTIAAGIGSGLIAGTFFVFSVAIMPAFRQLPREQAISAMNRINEVIQNAVFLNVFLGTAVVSAGLAVWSFLNCGPPGTVYLLIGSLLYLIGSFGVTVAFNVPLNNSLAGSNDPGIWTTYSASWTFWNHVRTIASTLATGAFAVAAALMA